MIPIVITCVPAVLFIYFVIPWLYAKMLRTSLTGKAKKHKVLALTFDDGPGDRLTLPLLDILKGHNAKATFFVLGRQIPGREHILKQIAEQGHEIGSHGYNHLNHWKVSPKRAIDDIKQAQSSIDNALGTSNTAYSFRPPFGKLNIVSLVYLLLMRIPIIYWTCDFGDTWQFDAWLGANDENQPAPVKPLDTAGDVILVHDFDRTDSSIDPILLKSVNSTLELGREKNLQIITGSELLKLAC